MECKKFLELIHDFILDKIEYSDELENFIEHAKTCASCKEELELYYMLHRGMGDVEAPYESGEIPDTKAELENIFGFYEEIFYKQKKMKRAGTISLIVFAVMVVFACIYVYFRVNGRI